MTPRLKRLGLGLAAALVVGLSMLSGFVAFLHTGPGERWVSGKLEENVAGLELDGYHLRWPFRMRADYLRLVDGQGTWLEVTKPELRWHPFRLMRRVLHIDRLAAAQVEVKRLPVASGEPSGDLPDIRGTLLLEELTAPIVLAPPVLGERLDLDLGGTFQMEGGGGVVEVHLRSAGGGLVRLAGTAGRDYLDLRWYLRIPQLTQWERLAGMPLAGEAVGSGFIAGRLPSPVVSGRLEVGTGRADNFRWNALALTGRVVPEPEALRVALMAEAQAPRWGDGKALVPEAQLSVVGDVSDGRIRLGHARLEAGRMALAGSGIVDQWGRHATLRVNAVIPDLAALDRRFKGGASLRGQLAGNLLQPDLRGQVQGWTRGFASGIAVLDRLLGDRPDARARFRYKDGALVVDDGSVRGAKARLWAAGPLGDRLNLWAKLSVPDLSVFDATLHGAGVAEGRVAGPLSDPGAAGVAHLAGLAVGGVPPGDGVLAFDLNHLAVKPEGMVTADMSVAGYPLDGRARLLVGGEVRLDDLSLVSGKSQVTGNLVVADGGVRGRLKGSIPELKAWEGLVGSPLSGRVEAEAVLDPSAGQSLRVSARGQGISGAGVTMVTVAADAVLTGLNATPTGSVTLAAQQVTRDTIRLDRLTAQGNGTSRAFAFTVDGSGAGARLEVDGSAQLNGTAGLARLDRLRLAWGGRNASLAQPSQIRWGRDNVVLAPSVLTLGAGRLDVEGRLTGRTMWVRARLDEVPLEMVDVVAPDLHAVGRVSGTANLDGTLDDPRARLDLTGRNVGFAAAARAGLGRLSTRLVADWRNGRVQADASARDGDRVQASVNGSLPLPGDGPVSARFSLSGDAGRISEALPLAGHVFAGRLEAEGSVGGTMAAPLVQGRASLTQGRYENLENGTLVSALTATAQMDGDRIRIQAQGGDAGRGSVRAEGGGGLDGGYDADVEFSRFTALRRDDVEAEINGTLRLEGDGSQGRLTGKLTVPSAELDIARIKGSGPVILDVVEINRPGAPPKPAKPEAADIPVTMALGVTVAVEHAFVRGRGLDSEWQGDVAVAGTVSQPSLTGRLMAVRGEYEALGKQFRLTPDSEVVFQGGDTIDPSLNVAAEASAPDITARIEVTGTANQPQLDITSQPPLPQDEVLARLLFGREAGKLSAFQQIQLAQMAASGLTGGGGGFDPIGKVRGFLGLDVLGIGSADTTPTPTGKPAPGTAGPTLSAGKYIGPDTFVRVEQGTAGLGRVTVEQELGGGFSVESSVGEQSGGGVGFNWRKDY
ncbi:MAG: translocation/assembly module TamB domain-containing protein [Rhodospirillaceae bacterium]|nr:translocation/assembly module TamB domain-containing protein [Rhodospirillales bacterium]